MIAAPIVSELPMTNEVYGAVCALGILIAFMTKF